VVAAAQTVKTDSSTSGASGIPHACFVGVVCVSLFGELQLW